jgi:putative endonuclease
MSRRPYVPASHASGRGFQPCIYILCSRKYGTLYVGVTRNIARRAWEHREGLVEGFTKRYGIKLLVYLEFHTTMIDAITREKQVKEWQRAWKLELIEAANPEWRDLYEDLI